MHSALRRSRLPRTYANRAHQLHTLSLSGPTKSSQVHSPPSALSESRTRTLRRQKKITGKVCDTYSLHRAPTKTRGLHTNRSPTGSEGAFLGAPREKKKKTKKNTPGATGA